MLVSAILAVLYLQFHKKVIVFNCAYDTKPDELLEFIENRIPGNSKKDVAAFFIFNQLPSLSNMETLNKLYAKFKNEITILALFNKKFKYSKPMVFPHKFFPRLKISCQKDKDVFDKNYFVILKNNRIRYTESKMELVNLVFLLQKYRNPQLTYSDFAVPSEELKRKITARLKDGNLQLLKLSSNENELLKDISDISRVYFVHASCSTCQLKELFTKLKLKQIIDNNEKNVIIFSVFADSFKLNKLIEGVNLNMDIYLDINDEFGLFSTITDEKENPLIIDLKGNTLY